MYTPNCTTNDIIAKLSLFISQTERRYSRDYSNRFKERHTQGEFRSQVLTPLPGTRFAFPVINDPRYIKLDDSVVNENISHRCTYTLKFVLISKGRKIKSTKLCTTQQSKFVFGRIIRTASFPKNFPTSLPK